MRIESRGERRATPNEMLGQNLQKINAEKLTEMATNFVQGAWDVTYDRQMPPSLRGMMMMGMRYHTTDAVGTLVRMTDPHNRQENLIDETPKEIIVGKKDNQITKEKGILVGIVGATKTEDTTVLQGVALIGKPEEKNLAAVLVNGKGEISINPQHTEDDFRLQAERDTIELHKSILKDRRCLFVLTGLIGTLNKRRRQDIQDKNSSTEDAHTNV